MWGLHASPAEHRRGPHPERWFRPGWVTWRDPAEPDAIRCGVCLGVGERFAYVNVTPSGNDRLFGHSTR